MSTEEYRLLEFITREFSSPTTTLDLKPEDDLLLTGLIDSMGVMRLVLFIETNFDVAIKPGDVTIENFRSVEAITEFLARLKACP